MTEENGHGRIVFATTAFGMGVDVKALEHIIHFGPPNDIDDYIQESGKADRIRQKEWLTDGSSRSVIFLGVSFSCSIISVSAKASLFLFLKLFACHDIQTHVVKELSYYMVFHKHHYSMKPTWPMSLESNFIFDLSTITFKWNFSNNIAILINRYLYYWWNRKQFKSNTYKGTTTLKAEGNQ